MEREKAFLGVDLAFPPRVDPQTDELQLAYYEDSVHQSIEIILGTAKGERLMRPSFGCSIHDLVFENNSAATHGKIAEAIREALLYFEPRIDVSEIKVEQGDEPGLLLISIHYEIRATNNIFNMVYPFYLEGGNE